MAAFIGREAGRTGRLRLQMAGVVILALVVLVGILGASRRAEGQACVDLTGRYLWSTTDINGRIDRLLEFSAPRAEGDERP
jgi:hypothetical protein